MTTARIASPSPAPTRPRRRLARSLTALAVVVTGGAASCGDAELPPETEPVNLMGPGEICSAPSTEQVRARLEPNFLVLAPGQTRSTRVVVDPDVCTTTAIRFESSEPSVVRAPDETSIDYGQPTVDLQIRGEAVGASEITVLVPRGDGTDATAMLAVEVLDATPLECSSSDDVGATLLEAGSTVAGAGSLRGATVGLPEGADKPNEGSYLWSVSPFETTIACGGDLALDDYVALGPAVTFGPEELSLQREIPLSVPVNPSLLPESARWRHLRLAYSGPAFREPRTITITNPRLEKVDGQWAVTFRAPRLGTYQAVVHEQAGTRTHSRRITHRAVVGVSMGGAGAAQFGLRYHHLFDVVAALGGPVDWTWMYHSIESNHVMGFRPIPPGTQLADIQLTKTPCTTDLECQSDEICLGVIDSPPTSGKCTLMPGVEDPYAHAQTFNNWWYEYPRQGNGGRFPRDEYTQIFRDLALMFGGISGYNSYPGGLHLPAGVDPEHPSQVGDRDNGECKIWVDPIDGHPDKEHQEELAHNCPIERCSHVQRLEGYYDDEYNPDGTFPVITFCDGAPQNELLSPYANTWTPEGNNYPLEVALAVDYNDNGVRDELEPVIRAGHENWDDWGEDQTPSAMEAGYGADNLDPAGDDYSPQYNPTGTEGDHRWQSGEAFEDAGLDGVMNTAASPYDWGEGDGEFTLAPGVERMWDIDPHGMVRQWSQSMADHPLDDEALARIDFWTDGGTRDLFNFSVAAQHLTGAFAARGRDTVYFSDFTRLPGLDPSQPNSFDPAHIVWGDLQGAVMMRYGKDDPGESDVEAGSGQHVGTAHEITQRLQTSMYYIGSRWPDAPYALVEESAEKPVEEDPPCTDLGCHTQCLVDGRCEFQFTDSRGRTGPVGVNVPPGYAHQDLQHERYPVIFMLHGYGMTPEDLLAAIAFLSNWMNGAQNSQASRLPKAILVYVDGRCRVQDGQAECLRGTFYTDSVREDGPQMDQWWLELMDYIDANFRTMGESVVEWTE